MTSRILLLSAVAAAVLAGSLAETQARIHRTHHMASGAYGAYAMAPGFFGRRASHMPYAKTEPAGGLIQDRAQREEVGRTPETLVPGPVR
jgi:hypothetical protein